MFNESVERIDAGEFNQFWTIGEDVTSRQSALWWRKNTHKRQLRLLMYKKGWQSGSKLDKNESGLIYLLYHLEVMKKHTAEILWNWKRNSMKKVVMTPFWV